MKTTISIQDHDIHLKDDAGNSWGVGESAATGDGIPGCTAARTVWKWSTRMRMGDEVRSSVQRTILNDDELAAIANRVLAGQVSRLDMLVLLNSHGALVERCRHLQRQGQRYGTQAPHLRRRHEGTGNPEPGGTEGPGHGPLRG